VVKIPYWKFSVGMTNIENNFPNHERLKIFSARRRRRSYRRPFRSPFSRAGRKLYVILMMVSIAGGFSYTKPFMVLFPQLAGTVQVTDGDTVIIGRERIRLYGIDAPELRQTCRRADGNEWPCGEKAHTTLAKIVQGGMECYLRDRDKYGRALGLCFNRTGASVNRALVQQGLALAFMDDSFLFTPYQWLAQNQKAGMWQGEFEEPQHYRRRVKSVRNRH
jgi:endonuclease YncB( thermonuclease family)